MRKRLSLLFLIHLFSFGKAASTETVSMTSYNSEVRQTDSTPFITSTGVRVRYGILAASPDLIRRFGYGATVRIQKFYQSRGCGATKAMLSTTFVIMDTTARSKVKTLDVWMPNRNQSIIFGRCQALVQITPS